MTLAVVTQNDVKKSPIDKLPPNVHVWVALRRHDLFYWTSGGRKYSFLSKCYIILELQRFNKSALKTHKITFLMQFVNIYNLNFKKYNTFDNYTVIVNFQM